MREESEDYISSGEMFQPPEADKSVPSPGGGQERKAHLELCTSLSLSISRMQRTMFAANRALDEAARNDGKQVRAIDSTM